MSSQGSPRVQVSDRRAGEFFIVFKGINQEPGTFPQLKVFPTPLAGDALMHVAVIKNIEK